MKSYIPFLPLFLALAAPAMLPEVIHPNMNSEWQARRSAMLCCVDDGGQTWVGSSSATSSAIPFFGFPPVKITVSTSDGLFAEISADGSLKVDWTRARQVSEQCFSKEGSNANYDVCAIARALVAARDGTWEELK